MKKIHNLGDLFHFFYENLVFFLNKSVWEKIIEARYYRFIGTLSKCIKYSENSLTITEKFCILISYSGE
ncbi:hypothetical protein OMQ_00782 [Enterococcus saccharolyticus subsp. saccharolyticus ATCC 43076]|uniref:Uncharacterized protein n=1 Tax=Enterococcus saccharolyticus subsp. saccharolyticus ATCC 43076 TaxID=1139996 RepID=S0JB14_9ENTE|nr:hypothetical protein OMQ_00782 [Enterococcus saccharolyticus subsp. saccharolyticus ATCC 43076]